MRFPSALQQIKHVFMKEKSIYNIYVCFISIIIEGNKYLKCRKPTIFNRVITAICMQKDAGSDSLTLLDLRRQASCVFSYAWNWRGKRDTHMVKYRNGTDICTNTGTLFHRMKQ